MRERHQAWRIVVEGLRPRAGGPDAAVRRLRQADWTAALALANAHLVAPGLFGSLAAAGRLGDLPDEVRDYLEMLHRCNGRRNASKGGSDTRSAGPPPWRRRKTMAHTGQPDGPRASAAIRGGTA